MARAQTIKFNYDDYKSLPESETKRYELIQGELVIVPSPGWRHQNISLRLSSRLDAFVGANNLGYTACAPLDVVLGGDVVQPDILFISHKRASIIREDEIRGGPDLVVETLSPTTAQRDRTYKRTLYGRHGVKEFWLVDPDSQTVEVLTLGRRGYRRVGLYGKGTALRSPLLPSLEMPLTEVF